MLLMYTTLAVALAALPAGPAPLLMLACSQNTSLAQQVVQHALLQQLLADPTREVLCAAPVPVAMQRAAALRQAGDVQQARGLQRMQAMHPEAAAACAAMATQKFVRVATLTGDAEPLVASLALEAAAYLHAGAQAAAGRVLVQLLVLRPQWRPDASLFNPDMQRAVERARAKAVQLPRRSLTVTTPARDTALFFDGNLVGLGHATVALAADSAHYLLALPHSGEAVGTRLVSSLSQPLQQEEAAPGPEPIACASLVLSPTHPAPRPDTDERFRSIFAATAAADGLVEPSLPVLAATNVSEVWVLGHMGGALQLTAFDLTRGRRQQSEVVGEVTSLEHGHRVAAALLARQKETTAALSESDGRP